MKDKKGQSVIMVKAMSPVVRQSARKLRLVVEAVKGIETPVEVLEALSLMPKRAAPVIAKTVKQAVGNATNNLRLAEQTLTMGAIEVGEGPTMKRHRFGGRGRVKPILKRTSRVTVILEGKKEGGRRS